MSHNTPSGGVPVGHLEIVVRWGSEALLREKSEQAGVMVVA